MPARGIPVQDTYPEGFQLYPVQQEQPGAATPEPAPESPRRAARRRSVTDPPAGEASASGEAE